LLWVGWETVLSGYDQVQVVSQEFGAPRATVSVKNCEEGYFFLLGIVVAAWLFEVKND